MSTRRVPTLTSCSRRPFRAPSLLEHAIHLQLRPETLTAFADSSGCRADDFGLLWIETAMYGSLTSLVAPYVDRGDVISLARLKIDGDAIGTGAVEVEHHVDTGTARSVGRLLRVTSRVRHLETGEEVEILRHLSVQRGLDAARSLGPSTCAATAERSREAGQIAQAIGDPNPLHSAASPVGGILPGLVVLARALRVRRDVTPATPDRIRGVDARFSRPVYSGQDIRVQLVNESEFKVVVEGVTVIRSVRLTAAGKHRGERVAS